jgi:BASS family bile acid:Na+ symporter
MLGGPLIVALAVLALLAGRSTRFTGFAFSLWVLVGVTAAMFYPQFFLTWGDYRLSNLIVPLIQIIMVGMGTTLSLSDFARVLALPRAVLVGIVLQFLVMPLSGFLLAHAFGFSGGVAAGIVLIGSVPGGVASNVMTYLAGGNVALSVTMTACSTLLSPIMTPLAMKVLAGEFVQVSFMSMMESIVRMIILPIIVGIIANRLLRGHASWARIQRALPIVSMVAICIVLTLITAPARNQLLAVAFSLLAVVMIHNAVGYFLGYWGARAVGLDETVARTASIEVGLQNAGMASGLAVGVLNNPEAGLAAAIFGPWMNMTGSLLASWWRGRPPQMQTAPAGSAHGQR